eukprot:c55409_g1_i1.p1 GENE.c55409_g1_i1~~c55409_g1_i1.p1  ORF type:complete len:197 (-),score=22.22 c55409_g1_i1:26-616(-)
MGINGHTRQRAACQVRECVAFGIALREMFVPKRRSFGLTTRVCTDPAVTEYLAHVMASFGHWIKEGALRRIELVVEDGQLRVMEVHQLDFALNKSTFVPDGVAYSALEAQFQMVLQRIKLLNQATHPPQNCSFRILAIVSSCLKAGPSGLTWVKVVDQSNPISHSSCPSPATIIFHEPIESSFGIVSHSTRVPAGV